MISCIRINKICLDYRGFFIFKNNILVNNKLWINENNFYKRKTFYQCKIVQSVQIHRLHIRILDTREKKNGIRQQDLYCKRNGKFFFNNKIFAFLCVSSSFRIERIINGPVLEFMKYFMILSVQTWFYSISTLNDLLLLNFAKRRCLLKSCALFLQYDLTTTNFLQQIGFCLHSILIKEIWLLIQ